jgi:hypothetical protein
MTMADEPTAAPDNRDSALGRAYLRWREIWYWREIERKNQATTPTTLDCFAAGWTWALVNGPETAVSPPEARWHAEEIDGNLYVFTGTPGTRRVIVALADVHPADDEARAIARRVVTAVNAHTRLVAYVTSLKEKVKQLRAQGDGESVMASQALYGEADAYAAVARELAALLGVELPCPTCDGAGVMKGDPAAPEGSIRRENVPCPECSED